MVNCNTDERNNTRCIMSSPDNGLMYNPDFDIMSIPDDENNAGNDVQEVQSKCFPDLASFRNAKPVLVLRLFIIALTSMITTSASSAILPSLLDDIYQHNYITHNSTLCIADNKTAASNTTKADCTFANKNILIGIFMSYTAVVEILATPLVPWFIRKIGDWNSILLSALMKLTGCLSTMYAKNLIILFVARFLHGFPVLISLTAGLVATCKRFPDESERKQVFSISFQGLVIGNLLSYFVGSSLYQYFGLQTAFFVLAVFHIIEVLICLFSARGAEYTDVNSESISWCAILSDGTMMLAFIYEVHAWHYFTAWRSTVPQWLLEIGANAFETGLVLASATIGQLCVSLLFDLMKFKSWKEVAIAQIASVMGFSLLPFTFSNFWVSICPDILILFGYSVTVASVGVLIASRIEVSNGSSYLVIYTFYMLISNIGMASGGPYGGLLVESVGFLFTCLITAGISAILTMILLIYWILTGRESSVYESID